MNKVNLASVMAIIALSAISLPTQAGNVQCMGVVLSHILENFEQARTTSGVIAIDLRNQDREVNIGHVDENNVTVRDIGKDSFEVIISFDSRAQGFRNSSLKTDIYDVNYESCEFDRSQKIIYRLHR